MNRMPRDTGGRDPRLRRWEAAGLIALATIVVTVPLSLMRSGTAGPEEIAGVEAAFVGSAACRDCHATQFDRWVGSDHDKAMDLATDETVLAISRTRRSLITA